MTLQEIIVEKIHTEGAMPFDSFMEMSLYHPEKGYYSRDYNPIGSGGDFFTIPYLDSSFGAMLARQLEEMWEILGRQGFTIVEVGAGNGILCSHILTYIKKSNPTFYSCLQYYIIEKSETMIKRAKSLLNNAVDFYSSLEELPSFQGCVLSNELFDNFPVAQVLQKKQLMEIYVDYSTDFFEVLRPARIGIINYVSELEINLPAEYRAEINLGVIDWIGKVSHKLLKGFMLTIDYGHVSEELYHYARSEGTITCYSAHTINHNPYLNIGRQDITSHINFSAIVHYGSLYGFGFSGFSYQGQFLRSLGLLEYLSKKELEEGSGQIPTPRQIANALLQQTNDKFKVLLQFKGVPYCNLRGLNLRLPFKHTQKLSGNLSTDSAVVSRV